MKGCVKKFLSKSMMKSHKSMLSRGHKMMFRRVRTCVGLCELVQACSGLCELVLAFAGLCRLVQVCDGV